MNSIIIQKIKLDREVKFYAQRDHLNFATEWSLSFIISSFQHRTVDFDSCLSFMSVASDSVRNFYYGGFLHDRMGMGGPPFIRSSVHPSPRTLPSVLKLES